MDKLEHVIATKITNWMNQFCSKTENERVIITYGIEVFVDNVFKLFIYLLMAMFIGVVKECLIMIILFAILRRFAGGMHFDKNIICFLVTGLIFVGGGFLSKVMSVNHFVWVTMMLFSGTIFLKYSPSGTKKNPVKPENRILLKTKTVITFLLYIITVIILDDSILINAVMIISIVVSITILPVVNRKYLD